LRSRRSGRAITVKAQAGDVENIKGKARKLPSLIRLRPLDASRDLERGEVGAERRDFCSMDFSRCMADLTIGMVRMLDLWISHRPHTAAYWASTRDPAHLPSLYKKLGQMGQVWKISLDFCLDF
jgi:hypothetical protein